MNGKVHYWIVCDAVAYIKNYGTPLQKRALQSFELAYGQRKSIEEIPVFSERHGAIGRFRILAY